MWPEWHKICVITKSSDFLLSWTTELILITSLGANSIYVQRVDFCLERHKPGQNSSYDGHLSRCRPAPTGTYLAFLLQCVYRVGYKLPALHVFFSFNTKMSFNGANAVLSGAR